MADTLGVLYREYEIAYPELVRSLKKGFLTIDELKAVLSSAQAIGRGGSVVIALYGLEAPEHSTTHQRAEEIIGEMIARNLQENPALAEQRFYEITDILLYSPPALRSFLSLVSSISTRVAQMIADQEIKQHVGVLNFNIQ